MRPNGVLRMTERDEAKDLDILFGLVADDLEHWEKQDWYWFGGVANEDNELVAYEAMTARWHNYANRLLSQARDKALQEAIEVPALKINEIEFTDPKTAHYNDRRNRTREAILRQIEALRSKNQ